ncbi:MAG: transposase [Bellilinea sp.]
MNDEKVGHQRKSIRLSGYDYSLAGGYFVTIVTKGREQLFGSVADGKMKLNVFGRIVHRTWMEIPAHYPYVELAAFCVMPNHFHGIIILTDNRRGGSANKGRVPEMATSVIELLAGRDQTRPYARHQRHGLPEIVRWFKSFSARRINTIRKISGVSVWQRNYYEHIIRDERNYANIFDYIQTNPLNWETDEENSRLGWV